MQAAKKKKKKKGTGTATSGQGERYNLRSRIKEFQAQQNKQSKYSLSL